MSETTDHTNQTCPGFFKRLRVGTKLRSAWLAYNNERMANVLEGMVGVGGIKMHKPRSANGAGWTIDGSGITGSSGIPADCDKETVTIYAKEFKLTAKLNSLTVGGVTTYYGLTDFAKVAYSAADARLLLQVKSVTSGSGTVTTLEPDKGYLKS